MPFPSETAELRGITQPLVLFRIFDAEALAQRMHIVKVMGAEPVSGVKLHEIFGRYAGDGMSFDDAVSRQ